MGMHAILWAERRPAESNKTVTVVMRGFFGACSRSFADTPVRRCCGEGGSVKYLLLICGDESAAAHAEDGCSGWMEEMQERGQLQVTGGLPPPGEAKTVRVRRPQLPLSHRPFAQTQEPVARFCILERPGLSQAVRPPA